MNKVFAYLFFVCCVSVLFSCTKEYSFEQGNISPAAGSLWDSTGTCLPSTVHGTFYNGIPPGADTAYVEIQVNVTQTGSYNITSDIQDGFQFLDSGFFSSTGINTIRLKPIGIPTIPVSATFNIGFDSSFCTFTVNVQDSTGTGLGGGDTTGTGLTDTTVATTGTWQFNADGGLHQGNFDSISIKDTLGYKYIILHGKTSLFDSSFSFFLSFPGGVIAPSTYNIQDPPPTINGFQLDDPSGNLVYIDITNDTSPGTGGQIIVDSYNIATQELTGTFSGIANDASFNPVVNVTNGSFTVIIP